MSSIQHAARDFHAISSTIVSILTEAICATNALSLHLHGALGPGFDYEKVCDSACVEDLLSAPMKRCLSCRRSFIMRALAAFVRFGHLTTVIVLMALHLPVWIYAAAAQVLSMPCSLSAGEIVLMYLSQCALRPTTM
jgi:hypothetical protein